MSKFAPFLPDMEYFKAGINSGLISIQQQPQDDLTIWNYTNRAAFTPEEWSNPAVRVSRGLVTDWKATKLVALPFPKFWNLGEMDMPIPSGDPEVTVKLDGALGIGFSDPRDPTKVRWTTRGSLTSDQGKVAQEIWDRKYASAFAGYLTDQPDYIRDNHLTLLAEIIHPSTRQVVRYDYEDLVLIGITNTYSGIDYPYEYIKWLSAYTGMPFTRRLDLDFNESMEYVKTLDDQHEGVVLRWDLHGCPLCFGGEENCMMCNGNQYGAYRLKLKSSEYLRVFQILRHASPTQIAKAWANGTLDAVWQTLPEEFRWDIECVLRDLKYQDLLKKTLLYYKYIEHPLVNNRKDYAQWVNSLHVPTDIKAALFAHYDDKPFSFRKTVAEEYCKSLKD